MFEVYKDGYYEDSFSTLEDALKFSLELIYKRKFKTFEEAISFLKDDRNISSQKDLINTLEYILYLYDIEITYSSTISYRDISKILK